MKYITKSLEFHNDNPSVITLGKFDGLHRGHDYLMNTILEVRNTKGYDAIVFTFDIPPKNRVMSEQGSVLTTNDEKHYVFERRGVDMLIECPFTKEVMCMEPEDFVKWIVTSLNIKCIVVGTDFRFGHDRRGDYKLLQKLEETYGYTTMIMEKVQEDGRDISSTFVREEIARGNIEKADHLLGYPYFIKSKVIHGNQIGRKMGIPTINMELPPEKLLPPNGVYITRVIIGEESYKGVSNVGVKPTIEGTYPIGVETFILDFCQDLYEQDILVEFLSFVRSEKKFDTLEALKTQISSDIAYTRSYYENVTN